MLEVEWMLRRKMVVEDMEVGDDMMLMETLTEQIRLLDVWKDDMVNIAYVREPNNKKAFLEDEDDEMEDMHVLCVRLGVEDMEQEDGPFSWGEEVLAHMEIDSILKEHKEAEICEPRAPDSKLGVGLEIGVGNGLAYMTAYY